MNDIVIIYHYVFITNENYYLFGIIIITMSNYFDH
jgi:hypothetical protein